MQRLTDIAVASVLLLLLAPLLIPIAIVLRLTGEGEIFFKQNRVGRDGNIFRLYKFATMLKNSPNLGTGTVTLKDDPRILPVGRVLRKAKINELPQLLNVLLGDMSLIGPRPQTQRCFETFPPSSRNAIISVRPGLSGIGSVVFRDEEEMMHAAGSPDHFYDHVIMPYKGKLEEWYVRNNSITVFWKLVFITTWVVLLPKSRIVWKAFPDLPRPSGEIAEHIEAD